MVNDGKKIRARLERAVPFLRLPSSPDRMPEVMADGTGLRCPVTGRIFPYRAGILDLLESPVQKTITQRSLDTTFTAWAYDQFRNGLARFISMHDFPTEVATVQKTLDVQPGSVVLDLACGPGNFTIEWAKRAGPTGLVMGLDLSLVMLERAVVHVRRWDLENVLLILGDAQQLPFADRSLTKVNCSGGFHQFPDLPQALREIARVSSDGAVLTASMFAEGPTDRFARGKQWAKQQFALHFVPLMWLGQQLESLGYVDYQWSLPSAWVGYTSARKRVRPLASEEQ